MFWVCVCSLKYPASNAHALYCHLWPARPYKIFPHYLINGTIIYIYISPETFVLIVTTNFVLNISNSKKNWARYYQKYILIFIYSNRNSCHILVNFVFSRRIFEKYSSTQFHENPPSGRRVVPYGRTNRRKERQTWRILTDAFPNFSNTPKNCDIKIRGPMYILLYCC